MADVANKSGIKNEEAEELTSKLGLTVYNISSLSNDFNMLTLMDFLARGDVRNLAVSILFRQRNRLWL